MIVTKDPKTHQLSVSQIGSPSTLGVSGWTLRARFQNPNGKRRWWPASINTACILYSEEMQPNWKQCPVSYAVHVGCWEFLDRIIGHEVVQRHWETFIDITQAFWLSNIDRFGCWYADGSRRAASDNRSRDTVNAVVNPQDPILPLVVLKHDAAVLVGYHPTVHEDSGWLGLPGMHELASKVVRPPRQTELLATTTRHLAHLDIPVELAIMIVEIVRLSHSDRLEAVRDTRNMLAAFQWRLPDAYWISRSNGHLKFEMQQDALDRDVDWERVCLDIEEMWLSGNDCAAATKNRAQALGSLGITREFLLREVEKKSTQSKNLAKGRMNWAERRTTFRVLGCRRISQRKRRSLHQGSFKILACTLQWPWWKRRA
jgi:hypothetical protein